MTQVVDIKGVGKVNFPDTMTPEQIEQAIERDILPQNKPTASERTPVDLPTAARFGRGAQDVLDRVSQLAISGGEKVGLVQPGISDIATDQMNAERAQYEKDRLAQGGSKFDVARMVGNIGMQSPLMLIPGGKSFAGRAALGAVQGGASGAMQYDPTNTLKQSLKNTALGAGVGAVVSPVVGAVTDKAGDLVRRLFGRAKGAGAQMSGEATEAAVKKAIPEIETLPASAQDDLIREGQQQIRNTGALSAEQLSRKANLVANDVTPTKAMVTRNPQDWAMERNLSKLTGPDPDLQKIGGTLTDIYQANDKALTSRLYKIGESVPKATQEGYGMTVMKSLDELADASQKDVSKLYESVRKAHGAKALTSAENVFKVLNDPDIVDNVDSAPIIGSVTARLRRYGLINESGETTGKALTVSQAEEFRKFLGKIGNSPNTGRIAREFVNAIDEDVLSGSMATSPIDEALATARELKKLAADNGGTVYVRWSKGSQFDLANGARSIDKVSGQPHPGLSAVPIASDMTEAEVLKYLGEYGFLRMNDDAVRPFVYAAKRIATDSDGYPSISPTKLLSSPNAPVEKVRDAVVLLSKIEKTKGQLQSATKSGQEVLNDYLSKDLEKFRKLGFGEADDFLRKSGGFDYFGGARHAASERFKSLENPATQRALNAYGELTQGKTAQNFIKSQVIDAPAQDVKTLVSTLGKIGDEAKRKEAMDAMKGGVLSYLESKAVNPNSGQFSGAALNKAIANIGDEKLELTLGKEGAAKLKSLTKAALDVTYQPPYSAVNASNTTPAALSLIRNTRKVLPIPLPFINEAAEQGAARAGYSSQLAEALKAQSGGQMPRLPARAEQIGKALAQLGIPASQAALDQARKPPDKKAKNR